jgi:uncharacterized membrane protein YbhN (UPF0104 family)
VAYLISKVDLRKTVDTITGASLPMAGASAVLTLITVPPQAWRWQMLLRARGVRESIAWLTRVLRPLRRRPLLPTGVEATPRGSTRRRAAIPARASPTPGRSCSSARSAEPSRSSSQPRPLLAIGRYPIAIPVDRGALRHRHSRGGSCRLRLVRRHLRRIVPLLERLKVERFARALYEGIHGYRYHVSTMFGVAAITLAAQVSRIFAIWAGGRAVGVEVGIRPYIVLGPLLFLVMLVPFTVNGLGVREAFFSSASSGALGSTWMHAFATGLIFFLMTLLLALPGVVIILWEGFRRSPVPVADG